MVYAGGELGTQAADEVRRRQTGYSVAVVEGLHGAQRAAKAGGGGRVMQYGGLQRVRKCRAGRPRGFAGNDKGNPQAAMEVEG